MRTVRPTLEFEGGVLLLPILVFVPASHPALFLVISTPIARHPKRSEGSLFAFRPSRGGRRVPRVQLHRTRVLLLFVMSNPNV